jgi:IPT/TIG domain-containing protein
VTRFDASVALFVGFVAVPPAFAELDWIRSHPADSPSARSGAAVAYDASRHRVVLFGGDVERSAAGPSNETWTWDGTTWKQSFPEHRPSARRGHAMAFDSWRGRVVLFGGESAGEFLGDTWEWDGEDWSLVPTDGPAGRTEHALAFDSARGRTVLYGGRFGDRFLADTWTWDGAAWTEADPISSPPPLARLAMTFDSARGRAVLFGGDDGFDGSRADTWEWDGVDWRAIVTYGGPLPREGHAMTYDDASGVTILFGGEWRSVLPRPAASLDDAWEWTGSRWSRVPTSVSPVPLPDSPMAWDSACGHAVFFGRSVGPSPSAETWRLAPRLEIAALHPLEGSESGGDLVVLDGLGFTDASDTSVTVGGTPAEVISLSCNRVIARTPSGRGTVDVVVESAAGRVALGSAFSYVSPEIAARFGRVDRIEDGPAQVLLVNGSGGGATREMHVRIGEPLWLFLSTPASRDSARFAVWAWVGEPAPSTLSPLPGDVGTLVFPIGRARAVFNTLGHRHVLGSPTRPSSPAPTLLAGLRRGIRRPGTITLQGVIEDESAGNPIRVSTTNAVVVHFPDPLCTGASDQ